MGAAGAVEAEEDGAGFTGAADAEDPNERLCGPSSADARSDCAEEDAVWVGEVDETCAEDPGGDLGEDGAPVYDLEGADIPGVGRSGADPGEVWAAASVVSAGESASKNVMWPLACSGHMK